MYSIKRHIEPVISRRAKNNKAILLTGPRQVGKSTLFKHLFSDVKYVTFDDDILLSQATDDINLFLMNNEPPVVIDEVQKCPSFFNRAKMILDSTDKMSMFYFTGSQKLQLIKEISESMAGRVSIIELDCLSMREVEGVGFNSHFVPTLEYIKNREKCLKPYTDNIWSKIHRGFYPELIVNSDKEWIDFYQSYVKTYIERDVNSLINAKNHLTFVKFMTAVAARTGQVLNYANIASSVGVSEITIKQWVSILEKSGLVYILKPYTPSALAKAIKTPKIYFRDTGLCSYLTRWLTPETLKNGAMAGAMFETFVVNEILKSYSNEGMDYDFCIYYYNGRDRVKKGKEVDGEIDLIIQEDGILYPIEIKLSGTPKVDMASEFDVLDGVPDTKRGMGAIICLYDKKLFLRENLVALPVDYI